MRHHHPRRPWWLRRIYYSYYCLLRSPDSPARLSRGVAAGAFAGFFPLFGLQTILGVLFAILIRGNRLAAAATTWISNPLTYVPIYAFNYAVGQWLLPLPSLELEQVDWDSSDTLTTMGGQFALTLGVGCVVMGIVAGLVCYALSYWGILRLHRTRQLKRLRKVRRDRTNPLYKSRVRLTR